MTTRVDEIADQIYLVELRPRAMASMHGSGYQGDCAGALRRIGAGLEAIASGLAAGAGVLPSGAGSAAPLP